MFFDDEDAGATPGRLEGAGVTLGPLATFISDDFMKIQPMYLKAMYKKALGGIQGLSSTGELFMVSGVCT